MNAAIFLTLLCLGIASAAPKVDHSLDAQSDLWEASAEGVLDSAEDTINDAEVEKSHNVVDKDHQEHSKEQQSSSTESDAFGVINLKIKLPKGILGKIKSAAKKATLGKTTKGLGKKILGGIKKKGILGKAGKSIGKHILGGLTQPEILGELAKAIGKSILGGKKAHQPSEDSLSSKDTDYSNKTTEE